MERMISVAIDLFGAAISLIILLYLVLGNNRKIRQNRLFSMIVMCNIAILVADAISWSFDGVPGPQSVVITRTVSFLGYVFMFGIIGAFTLYSAAYLESRTARAKRLTRVTLWVCAFSVFTVFLSQFGGLYYYIDENNFYHRGRLYWVSQALVFAGLLLNIIIVVVCRKALNRKECISFLSYLLLPIVLNVMHIWEYRMSWACVATTLAVVIIYAGIQSEQSRRLAAQAVELAESKMSMMRSQIQDHFLYNTLGTIQDLCRRDPAQAEQSVGEFALYLRGNVDSIGYNSPVPFEKELEHTRVYLSLEQLRFEERLRVQYDIEATGFALPALSIQPLIENAVKHGVTRRVEGGTVTLSTKETPTHWCVTIEDDGVGYDVDGQADDGQTHIGVENVRSRLKSMCGGTLEMQSTKGTGTTAHITIPKQGGKRQ